MGMPYGTLPPPPRPPVMRQHVGVAKRPFVGVENMTQATSAQACARGTFVDAGGADDLSQIATAAYVAHLYSSYGSDDDGSSSSSGGYGESE